MTTTEFPTRIIEITHHRDQILLVDDDVRDWLAMNDCCPIDPPEGSKIGVRGEQVYITADDGRPVALAPAHPGHIGKPLPAALAIKAEQWLVSTADTDEHWGISAQITGDEPVQAIRDRHRRALGNGISRQLAPTCGSKGDEGFGCTRKAFNRVHVDGEWRDFCRPCTTRTRDSDVPIGAIMPHFAFVD